MSITALARTAPRARVIDVVLARDPDAEQLRQLTAERRAAAAATPPCLALPV
jgi:hypothetical protein